MHTRAQRNNCASPVRAVTQEHQRPSTPPGHVERAQRVDDAPALFALPEDIERRLGELLGDWPYSPALATITQTCKTAQNKQTARGARCAREAAQAAIKLFERKAILVVAHTRWRWPPNAGPFVDLKQNFLMYVTRSTPLSYVHGALDHRLRVSATATTQTKRRRPCGQTVAVGYTTFRRGVLVLEDRETGAALPKVGDARALVADAQPLPRRAGQPETLAVHLNLHVERTLLEESSDDDEDAQVLLDAPA